MPSTRIRTKVEGDTLVLPELRSLIGKTVDIEVTEHSEEIPPADRWAAAAEAVKDFRDYDFDPWSDQRAFETEHAADHLSRPPSSPTAG